ncbi:MAG: hypothetical protein H0V05_00185 [Euzebyaceae bacterium]|nr:hypothetical protein [Euzebyaceae bacterium]
MDGNETITFSRRAAAPSAVGAGDLTDALVATDYWTDQMVADAGIPMIDVPFVTVGGGIGSFVMVDYLRIAGVAPEKIKVLTQLDKPYEAYAYLCRNSQIPGGERLRSDSSACPDNIWGFPAYAIREAVAEKTLKPLWNVFTEPVIKDYYTPRAAAVFRAMDREAARIGWDRYLEKGQVRMVRRRAGGGYFTILTPPQGTTRTKRVAYRSLHAHIAVGYPALRFLPDLQKYRETYNDRTRVVNAYEPHEHVYEELRRRPGVVMVRGAGIVASRILQRLVDDRDHHGAQTLILHLFRTYRDQPYGDRHFGLGKRPAKQGWAYQGFNVTKATWGGQHRKKLLTLEGEERKKFINYIGGGAHTPNRVDWKEQLKRGTMQGFYRQAVGVVEDVVPSEDGSSVVSMVRGKDGTVTEFPAKFIIDCTGLEGSPREHRLLADLLGHSGATTNPSGRLDCSQSFEVRGSQSPPGKLYASGAATAGSYYGGVDSFLGLQYVAQRIYEDLAAQGFCKRIGPGRSVSEWMKWMRNTPL